MGLEDRDWYRAEIARQERRPLHVGYRRLRRWATMAAVGIAALLVLPIAVAWQRSGAPPLPQIVNATPYGQQTPGACGYYTNSSARAVPRPCGDWRSNQVAPPNGATALCSDGAYSYSEHPYATGMCSYHGGVVQHLR